MSPAVEPIRRANVSDAVADRLRRQIGEGRLAPGQRLAGHRELAATYSVSVGSVREAISMLISEGLVETRPGRGTFVADSMAAEPATGHLLQPGQVKELIEAREVLEFHIVEMAAGRATAGDLQTLETTVDAMQAASRHPKAFLEADLEFHLALAEAAKNSFLLDAMRQIRSMLRRDLELSAEVGMRRFGTLQFAVDEHRAVLDAIRDKDAAFARAAIDKVVSRNRDFVLDLYACE